MAKRTGLTRRGFLGSSTVGGLALATVGPRIGWSAPGATVRVGVIGCGGRGSGAAKNCVDSSPGVQIVARRSGTVTVAGDIAPGDEVVVEGVLRLREGAQVTRAGGAEGPEPMPAKPEGAAPEAVSGSGEMPAATPRAAARAREAG